MALKGLHAGMISLGCVKNRVDSEQMLSQLKEAGCLIVADPADADILIVNTCGFIAPAKEESIDTIFEMAEYKKSGRCKVLCVTGCLSQRYDQELANEIPEIDCMLGVSQYAHLAEHLESALNGQRPIATQRNNAFLECGRVLTTPPYSAYIKTGDGCDNKCAYCAIPLIRGSYRSRSREAIFHEMRTLARQGVKEHILIAQDTTRYGIDTKDSLSSLMEEAAQIPGVDWLRALYMYPDETNLKLLETMAAHENICKYLDLPLQHAAPGLLKKMNRRGSVEHIKHMLTTARSMGFCLRTTFIVGFPGETEKDFDELMAFTEEMAFDRMGAFTFSPEDDTPAAEMPGQVPEEIKEERLNRLMALQAKISLSRNQKRVGQKEKLLVTGFRGDLYTARSAWEAPDADGEILLFSNNPLSEGQFITAKITGADTYDLTAEEISY
ncbi:MAG: 30S ribosomal protein S12 methylthiotransferase RimO [Clostridiales bacterium]|nr:30S ribosomal protein S12 methylthiotransferase RimO [Clostridiales bacterium]